MTGEKRNGPLNLQSSAVVRQGGVERPGRLVNRLKTTLTSHPTPDGGAYAGKLNTLHRLQRRSDQPDSQKPGSVVRGGPTNMYIAESRSMGAGAERRFGFPVSFGTNQLPGQKV